ncbi:hypothetical protein phiLo_58 [Thermus phage phiLo]|nr:hypothetical protein phiLo_58 [Thermus phage phiLo]
MLGNPLEGKMLQEAQSYEKDPKYAQWIELAENFRQKLYRKPLSPYDKVALGRYLKTWESMLPILEADATTRNELGDIIRARLGLVALQYGTLPITDLASVQPLSEEAGIVYYRKLVATSTRGGVTAGTEIGNPFGIVNANPDYYSEATTYTHSTSSGSGGPGDTFSFTLPNTPLRKRYVSVMLGASYKAVDDGEGNLLGNGIFGTVDYDTGAVTVTVAVSYTPGTDNLTVTYHQNLVESTSVPGFKWELRSKLVQTQFFAIYSQFSSVTEYVIKQRFGRLFAEDLVYDATTQINAAVLSRAVKLLHQASMQWTPLTWSQTPPAGVSAAEHRLTFLDMLESAITEIGNRSGAAAKSFIVTGLKGRVIMATLGLKSQPKSVTGPYLVGHWDGVPVYYAPPTVLPDNVVLVGYRGESWFEAPIVYAPYLPIMTVRGSASPNPMLQNTVVAHAAGLESVAPEFVQRIEITI